MKYLKYLGLSLLLFSSFMGIAQTVTSVSSTAANGTYKVGDVIPITVTFSANVTVTGRYSSAYARDWKYGCSGGLYQWQWNKYFDF